MEGQEFAAKIVEFRFERLKFARGTIEISRAAQRLKTARGGSCFRSAKDFDGAFQRMGDHGDSLCVFSRKRAAQRGKFLGRIGEECFHERPGELPIAAGRSPKMGGQIVLT